MTFKDVLEIMLESGSELDDDIEIRVRDYEGHTKIDMGEVEEIQILYDRRSKDVTIEIILTEREEDKEEEKEEIKEQK